MDTTLAKVRQLRHYARQPTLLGPDPRRRGRLPARRVHRGLPGRGRARRGDLHPTQGTLRSVLATLSEREASIVRLRYGLADGQPRTWTRSATFTGSPGNGSGSSSPRR
jgi:RNA polymerase primary sigma factor